MLADLKVMVIVFKKMRQNSNDEEESELVVHGGFIIFWNPFFVWLSMDHSQRQLISKNNYLIFKPNYFNFFLK
jgi:hypothetical protein